MTIKIVDLATGLITERELTAEEISAIPPPAVETPKEKIIRLLSEKGLSQIWQIESALAGMQALAQANGFTEEQLYAVNPGYKEAKDLYTEILVEKTKI